MSVQAPKGILFTLPADHPYVTAVECRLFIICFRSQFEMLSTSTATVGKC